MLEIFQSRALAASENMRVRMKLIQSLNQEPIRFAVGPIIGCYCQWAAALLLALAAVGLWMNWHIAMYMNVLLVYTSKD